MADDRFDLSTAARVLNAGLEHLERLLGEGTLCAEVVGDTRRIQRDELLAFKAKRDAARRAGLRELTRLSEEFGGYDRE